MFKPVTLTIVAFLLSGCLDESERFLAATNDCKREMRFCRTCEVSQGDLNLPNGDALKFYALCMDRSGYSMGLNEAQRCWDNPGLQCYGMSDKLSSALAGPTARIKLGFNTLLGR